MELILASGSPRRKELLKKITTDFKIEPSSIDESKILEKSPIKFALLASQLKAKDVGDRFPEAVVIGADTIVVLNGKVFGKPKDHDTAKQMLSELSGRPHKVMTGLALYNSKTKKFIASLKTTIVTFKKLSDEDIEAYLNKVEVLDKAGAYAIQEFGDSIIDNINGDHDNVVGLPVDTLRHMLDEFSRILQS